MRRPRPKSGDFADVRLAARKPAPLPDAPRKFYPKPRNSDEAFALIPQVLADMDELLAARTAAEKEASDASDS